MALFCSCGAELPDNARFCHRCGKPQREQDLAFGPQDAGPPPTAPPEPPAPPVGFGNAVAVRTALLCASLSALLNSLPIVSFGCCLWLIGAGFLSTYVYSRRTGLILLVGDGARLGWITGLLTFVITMILTSLNFLLARSAAGGIREALRQSMERMPAQDEVTRQVIEFMTSPAGLAIFLLGYLVLGFLAMVSLTVAGGALGAKVMEKD